MILSMMDFLHSKARTSILFFLLLPLLSNCQSRSVIRNYDLDNPVVLQLEKELHEISGIEIVNNNIYAVGDDKGVLYELDIKTGKTLRTWNFGSPRDYEGLAFFDNRFYVLNSNGNIFQLEIGEGNDAVVAEYKFPFGKGNEFEVFYFDKSINKFMLICKECKDDNKQIASAYTFDPSTQVYEKAGFGLDAKAIADLRGAKKERIKASGGAIHPLTGELYIVSSINKMLLVTDKQGRAVAVHDLKRSNFEQPEGVGFTPSGDLYISNEKGSKKTATIVIYRSNQ